MESLAHFPAIEAGFILLYFSRLEGVNVLAALGCFALAHCAKKTAGQVWFRCFGVGARGT